MQRSRASRQVVGVADGQRTLRVCHRTRYTYAEPVQRSLHRGLLTPRETAFQHVVGSGVKMDPPPKGSTTHTDYFGNQFTLFTIDTPHDELLVEAESELNIGRPPLGDLRITIDGGDLQAVRKRIRQPESPEGRAAYEFLFDSPHVWQGPDFADYGAACFRDGDPFLSGVNQLMGRIHSEFRYDPTVTTISTPVSEVLVHKSGVCQDFAHLMIACLRSLGLAARYVSGYLVPGPDVVGAQASHAWVSVYCPGNGWTDFDPTNNVLAAGDHITLAWGRDFSDVSPFQGVVVGGGEHEVSVSVSVFGD
jgi:transglutaminase-like putative cysteine protease